MVASPLSRGRLFRKYAGYFVALVCAALLTSGASALYFAYQESRAALLVLQREKAVAAAYRIERFISEIENQVGWTYLPQGAPTSSLEQLRFEYLKLLRQVPAITEATRVDENGREQLRVSRLAPDVVGSGADLSSHPGFVVARAGETYHGPVYFRRETEPYMTVALAGGRRTSGVTVVEVNLKFVWDVTSRIEIGEAGHAYVVDAEGRLISHPDISLVLQKVDLSGLSQVQAGLAALPRSEASETEVATAHDRQGAPVLTAFATIAPLGWVVFVEQPRWEAFAPLKTLVLRIAALLLAGLLIAILASLALARRMVAPIRAMEWGAARIGGGSLDHRIRVGTGDELESLAEQFNRMAGQLQASYADLEEKIEERTRQLRLANQAKTRFFAAASHDLRQPLHALGLFVAQLRDKVPSADAIELVEQAQASVDALGELLNALLDISKLDAGALTPAITAFPINPLLERMLSDFGPVASEKGIRLRVVPSRLSARSDPVLLERILINLVANAVRYTERGGVLVGCRRRGPNLRIEVWDTGRGIPKEQQEVAFEEFSQLDNPERSRGKGLGLGLAIVKRLASLLEHRIDLASTPGRGSVFSVEVPIGQAKPIVEAARAAEVAGDGIAGAFLVVVDDDPLVQQGMRGLLTGWGCHVVIAASGREALAELEEHDRLPDALICDYRLSGESGVEVIERLRAGTSDDIPAVLISGDTAPELLGEAARGGHPLLHKPVSAAKLRALLSQLLSGSRAR